VKQRRQTETEQVALTQAREQLAGLADEQAALRRVATLVAQGVPPAELFSAVTKEVAHVFSGLEPPLVATVVRFDPGPECVLVGSSRPYEREPIGSRWVPKDLYVSTRVLRTGRSARVDEADLESLGGPDAEVLRLHRFLYQVGSPVVVEGRLWGAMILNSKEPLPPDTDERLESFTELVATAIANAESGEALARLAEEQAALRRVATLVAGDAPSNDVFEAVATEVGKLLNTDITVVGRYDGDGGATAIGSWSVSGGGVPVGTRSAIGGHNVLTLVAETGKPARVEGYDDAEGEAADIARRYGWRSSIAAPIVVEGRLWGVMLVATKRPDPFPAGAEERLAAFTDLVATAVANTQAHDEVRRFGDEQAALGRVATLVAAGAPPEQVFTAVVEEVSSLLGLERIELVRYDGDDTGTVIAASGEHPFPAGSTWSIDDPSVMATVARTTRTARIDDYGALKGEIARVARSAGFQSAIGAPMTVEGRLWGVIIAISTDPEPIPERSEARLGQFTELVATAVANAEARQALERVAAEQATLRRIATLVAKGVQPDEVFAAVAEEIGRLLPAASATMGRFEADDSVTTLASWSVTGAAFPTGRRWPTEAKNIAWMVRQTGRSARRDDFSDATDPIGVRAREAGTKSAVGSPIVVEGHVWGVVTAASTGGLMPPDTEARLASFTELVATAIANAESQRALEQLADEQAALRRVATLVAQDAPPAEIFSAVSEEVEGLFDSGAAVLRFEHDPPTLVFAGVSSVFDIAVGTRWEFQEGMASAEVYRTGRSARVDAIDVAPAGRELGVVSSVATPIIVEGRLWGAVSLASTYEQLPRGAEERLVKFTQLVATAIANAEGRSELATSRRRIVAASDEARRRIERDLHDGTQQRLVSLGLAVRAAEANLPPERDDLRDELSGVVQGLVDAVEDLQEISRGIHPPILSKGGLGPALQALAHRSPIPVDLDLTTDVRLAEPIEVAAYFVASEALANAAKHSEASRIDVSLERRDGSLVLSVRDDGVGGADAARGSGIVGLNDRVEALGGSFGVDSRPGKGTQIVARLPLELELEQTV
jgi:GAF domain-containing protein